MPSTKGDMLLKNARIVLADDVLKGSILVRDGLIVDIGGETALAEAVDLEGDYLIPGLVELHTDHLEGHYAPRPKVRWNPIAAVLAHDAQLAASGITTVFDALRIGTDEDAEMGADDMRQLADAIEDGVREDRLRADHYIHLRCEVSAPDCLEGFEQFLDDPKVRMVSLMDHAPGQRQFRNLDTYRTYYQGKLKMPEDVFQRFCQRRMAQSAENSPGNRARIAELCHEQSIVLASHDDATIAHVDEARAQGIRIAEFPTTVEAASASRDAGMAVLMGAPNIVRGGSHSGNVAAGELARTGLLDILSSDYIPFSLIHSAFNLERMVDGITLPQAIAMVSKKPAEATGLPDRGEIAIGRRADLVRVRVDHEVPVVRKVWREGLRVI